MGRYKHAAANLGMPVGGAVIIAINPSTNKEMLCFTPLCLANKNRKIPIGRMKNLIIKTRDVLSMFILVANTPPLNSTEK
ncbi:hypothetical protein NT017_05200 [Prolixibacter sp. NT017]|nr:hypothetical protein NT017_05200 [Prolixibacter sp. NT017]